MSAFKIEWHDSGREPQCPPNPAFPNGKDIDIAEGMCREGWPRCKVDLPYPAKRIGYYMIECEACGSTVVVTTAGRPDDPRSVTMPCKKPDPREVH